MGDWNVCIWVAFQFHNYMHLAHCSPWRNVFFRREDLTCEILTLEPGASDDETLESEASLWTADSSENLNVDSEGATSDFSGVHS